MYIYRLLTIPELKALMRTPSLSVRYIFRRVNGNSGLSQFKYNYPGLSQYDAIQWYPDELPESEYVLLRHAIRWSYHRQPCL